MVATHQIQRGGWSLTRKIENRIANCADGGRAIQNSSLEVDTLWAVGRRPTPHQLAPLGRG